MLFLQDGSVISYAKVVTTSEEKEDCFHEVFLEEGDFEGVEKKFHDLLHL
jgi:hypothetical protein